jgi:hypothetical protein
VYLGFYVFGNYAVLATALVEVAATIFLLKRFPASVPERSKGFWVRFLPVIFVTTAFFLFGSLQLNAQGDYTTNGAFYADLHHHITSVTNFAYRLNVPPENPFFAGTPFQYSFLIDVYSAALVRLGMQLEIAFNLPAYFLILALFGLCYFFFLRLHPNKNMAFLAMNLLFFSTSVAVPQMLQDVRKHPNVIDWFLNPDHDYSGLDTVHTWTTQFVKAFLIPQRANDLGYPLAIIIFILLLEAIDLLKKRKSAGCRNLFLFAGILAGLLPTIREFTFLVVLLVALGLALFYRDKRWLWFFVPMLLLALPQLVPRAAVVAGGGSEMIAWEPSCRGWDPECVPPQGLGWIAYLAYSFNLTFFLAPVGFFFVSRKAQRVSLLLFLLLVIGVLFRFTPDPFNNMKFINFWQIGMCFLAAVAVFRIWNLKPEVFWRPLVAVVLFLVLFFTFFSGMISFMYDFKKTFVAYERGDMEFASFIRAHTEENAVFMTYGVMNAVDLAGRPKLMGYPGTVWSFGEKDWSQRLSDKMDFYAGRRLREILLKYNVSYVEVTHSEYYSDILFSFNYSAIKSAPFLELVYFQQYPSANPNPKHYWMGRWALFKVDRAALNSTQ